MRQQKRILEDRVGGNGWDGMDPHGESPLGGWISGMICVMAAGFYRVAIFDSPSLFFKFSFSTTPTAPTPRTYSATDTTATTTAATATAAAAADF